MFIHKYDYLLKLSIIGDLDVGKTCLLLRYTDDSFATDHLKKIGIDFKNKSINLENKLIRLQIWDIWDTDGQERFRNISKIYFKGAHGIILAYDIADQNSFNNIRNWIKQIETYAPTSVKKVLVGNKCDKPDRVISEEEGKKLANEYNMSFFETSAKTNKNVTEVFEFLTREILESITGKIKKEDKKSDVKKEDKKSKKEISNSNEIDNLRRELEDEKKKNKKLQETINQLKQEHNIDNEQYKKEINKLTEKNKELEKLLEEKNKEINDYIFKLSN